MLLLNLLMMLRKSLIQTIFCEKSVDRATQRPDNKSRESSDYHILITTSDTRKDVLTVAISEVILYS